MLFLQALDGWQVTAGYVGVVRGSLPLTATAAAAVAVGSTAADVNAHLTLDEVLITVAPTPAAAAASNQAAAGASTSSSTTAGTADAGYITDAQQQQTFADDLGMLGQIGVYEGIKLIAGGLEAVLQRLAVAATNVTIRVEVPAAAVPSSPAAAAAPSSPPAAACGAGAELILHLDCVHFADATPPKQQQSAAATAAAPPGTAAAGGAGADHVPAAVQELVKRVSVTGLLIELLELPDDNALRSTVASQAAGLGADALCRSQLLSQGRADAAATAAAMRESFMARSSMMRSSFMAAAAAAAAGGEGNSTTGAAVGSGAGQAAADLGGLLLGGPAASGLDLTLVLRLALSAGAAAGTAGSQPPRVTMDLTSSAVGVYLQPWQLPLMQLCSTACGTGSSSSRKGGSSVDAVPMMPAVAGAAQTGSSSSYGRTSGHAAQQQGWGQRSFVEELFFPHVEGFVADSLNLASPRGGSGWGPGGSLYNSVAVGDSSSGSTLLGGILSGGSSSAVGNAANGMYSMYHDARSVFSSVAGSISGAVASNLLSGLYSVPADTAQQGPISPLHDQTGSPTGGMYSSSSRVGEIADGAGARGLWQQPQPPAAMSAASWSLRGVCPSVYVCLHYHAPACVGQAGAPEAAVAPGVSSTGRMQQQQQQQAHPPCFVLSCGGLSAAYDVSGRVSHVSVKLYQLEAFEQLPADWRVVAGAASSSSSSSQAGGQLVLDPKVLGSVPRVLPQGSAGCTHQVSWLCSDTSILLLTDGSSLMEAAAIVSSRVDCT